MTLHILGIIQMPVVSEGMLVLNRTTSSHVNQLNHELMITCVVLNWPSFAGQDCPLQIHLIVMLPVAQSLLGSPAKGTIKVV